MWYLWDRWRLVVSLGLASILLMATVTTVFSGQSSSTDPDDSTAIASFKRQRLTGTAMAATRTAVAAPRTATLTPSPSNTPRSNVTAGRVFSTSTPSPIKDASYVIRLYAQDILRIRIEITNTQGEAANYLRYLPLSTTISAAHNAAVASATISHGATLYQGAAVVSLGGAATPFTGLIANDILGASFASYTFLINNKGQLESSFTATPTRNNISNASAVTEVTKPFDAAGTLTALPQILATQRPNTTPTPSQLTETRARDLIVLSFPSFAQLPYTPFPTPLPNTFAWYAKNIVTISNESGNPQTLNQTLLFAVSPSPNNKFQMTVTVARGNYTSLFGLP